MQMKMMTTEVVGAELHRRFALGIRPGLERLLPVLERLGSPHQRLGRVVHIAGSNGKGSVAAFVDRILRAAGHSCALYTSPHLVSECERLAFNGQPVHPEDFDRAARQVMAAERACAAELTAFEFITAAAFLEIARHAPGYSVVEVGLGGRLDATNVVSPVASVLMPVSLEHTALLGATTEAIAAEKIAIARAGIPCFVSQQPPEVMAVVSDYCRRHQVPLVPVAKSYPAGDDWRSWRWQGRHARLADIPLSLAGPHQCANAAVAAAVAEELLGPSPELSGCLAEGLSRTVWPGRFDLRPLPGGGALLLDGAHNPGAIQILCDSFRAAYSHAPPCLFGARLDKDVQTMLASLEQLVSRIVFTSPGESDGHAPAHLAALVTRVPVEVAPAPDAGLARLAQLSAGTVGLCCGSLYLVGYSLRWLDELSTREGTA